MSSTGKCWLTFGMDCIWDETLSYLPVADSDYLVRSEGGSEEDQVEQPQKRSCTPREQRSHNVTASLEVKGKWQVGGSGMPHLAMDDRSICAQVPRYENGTH